MSTASQSRPKVAQVESAGRVRFLGPFAIAGICIVSVFTLRSMPSVAEFGWASTTFYVLGALFFLIPLGFVCAELGSGWPKAGGLYAWVKQAFGSRYGFLAVWFEWVEDFVWFPVVTAFIAAAIAYIFEPRLANDKLFLVLVMLGVFWALTLFNFLGVRVSARINNVGLVVGTLVPAVALIGLGVYWIVADKHLAIAFDGGSALNPGLGHLGNVTFFAGVLLGYAGIELAGFHAKETRNPRRDFPRAFIFSSLLIVALSILATLAIAFVVPRHQLSLAAGVIQAFAAFIHQLGWGSAAVTVMAVLIVLGTLALTSSWVLGPSKGLYASEADGDLPPVLHRVNRHHSPVAILLMQGVLTTVFMIFYLFTPGVNTGYWMLSALTTQIVVIMYIMILAAGIRLRYTEPDTPRPYMVPGGKVGIWIVAGAGIVGCAFGFVIGFIPPSEISHWPTPIYVVVMAAVILALMVPAWVIDRVKKPSWIIENPDPLLLEVEELPQPPRERRAA